MARRVELPNVPAEYQYVQALTCESCGGPTTGQRTGAKYEETKAVDHWVITCSRCSHKSEIEFAVPKMDIAAMMDMLKKK